MQLFDIHTHLQDPGILPDIDSVLLRAVNVGIDKIVCCATKESDWHAVEELSQRFPEIIIPSFGIQPWFCEDLSSDWLQSLTGILQKVPSAIGEIGLDGSENRPDIILQEKVFIEQFRLARKFSLPVSVHCSNAWGRMVEICTAEGGVPQGGVIHSYSGSAELVPVFEKLGFSISFSRSVMLDKNKKIHTAVNAVSKDRLVIETDSPSQVSTEMKSTIGEPFDLSHILLKISQLLKITPEECADTTFQNSTRIYQHFIPV